MVEKGEIVVARQASSRYVELRREVNLCRGHILAFVSVLLKLAPRLNSLFCVFLLSGCVVCIDSPEQLSR